MRKLPYSFLLAIALFFLFPIKTSAQVVINEFSSNTLNDWVEVINTEVSDIDLSDYRLRDETATNKADLQGTLGSGEVVSFNFGRSLNKDGDTVKLMKVVGEVETLIDSIPYGSSGGVCRPSDAGSVGRAPDANNTIERFSIHTRDALNGTSNLDPCPTPTLSPTEAPTDTPTSTPEPTTESTSTTAPTPSPSPTVIGKKTTRPRPTIKSSDDENSEDMVIGLREELETPEATEEAEEKGKMSWGAIVFIIVGIGFIGLAGYTFYMQKQKGYTGETENEKSE